MSYPPIKNNARVKVAVRCSDEGAYSRGAIVARNLHDGQIGVVDKHHDSHGLCHEVKFKDGGVAFYDPDELEVQ